MTIATNLPWYNILCYAEAPSVKPAFDDFRWSLSSRGSYPITGAATAAWDGQYYGFMGGVSSWGTLGRMDEPGVTEVEANIELLRDSNSASELYLPDFLFNNNYLVGYFLYLFRVTADSPIPATGNLITKSYIGRGDLQISLKQTRGSRTYDVISVSLRGRLDHDDKDVQREMYDSASYGNIAQRWRNKKKPILFGEWDAMEAENAPSYDSYIEAPCVDTENNGQRLRCDVGVIGDDTRDVEFLCGANSKWYESSVSGGFKAHANEVLDHTTDAGWDYFKLDDSSQANWKVFKGTGNEIDPNRDYTYHWVDRDRIYMIFPTGQEEVATNNTAVNPVEIVKLLLEDSLYGMDLAASDYNAATFAGVKAECAALGYEARGWINSQAKVSDVIGKLCDDFGLKCYVKGGSYYIQLIRFDVIPGSLRDIYQEQLFSYDIYSDRNDYSRASFETNSMLHPRHNRRLNTIRYDVAEVLASGQMVKDCDWLWTPPNASATQSIRVANFGRQMKDVTIHGDFSLLANQYEIGDYVQVHSPEAIEGLYMIAATAKDYGAGRASLDLIWSVPWT